MTRPAVYTTIKDTVQARLPGSRVILFGSQAKGQQDRHSDYDLLVITPNTLSPSEKIYWHSHLDRAIVRAIHAPVDILLNSEDEVKEKIALPGHIVRSALREGILL